MVMPIEQLIATAPAWIDETWAARMDNSASALFLHGYITQSQRSAITRKIEAQFTKAIANGDIVERSNPNDQSN